MNCLAPNFPRPPAHSLRLLSPDEFDNAHPVREGSGPGARTRIEYDHKHTGERVRFYDYMDAATLLGDFWTEVKAVMKERSKSDD